MRTLVYQCLIGDGYRERRNMEKQKSKAERGIQEWMPKIQAWAESHGYDYKVYREGDPLFQRYEPFKEDYDRFMYLDIDVEPINPPELFVPDGFHSRWAKACQSELQTGILVLDKEAADFFHSHYQGPEWVDGKKRTDQSVITPFMRDYERLRFLPLEWHCLNTEMANPYFRHWQ